jgi:hypothetical protein
MECTYINVMKLCLQIQALGAVWERDARILLGEATRLPDHHPTLHIHHCNRRSPIRAAVT